MSLISAIMNLGVCIEPKLYCVLCISVFTEYVRQLIINHFVHYSDNTASQR